MNLFGIDCNESSEISIDPGMLLYALFTDAMVDLFSKSYYGKFNYEVEVGLANDIINSYPFVFSTFLKSSMITDLYLKQLSENRNELITTGYPKNEIKISSFFDQFLTILYPTNIEYKKSDQTYSWNKHRVENFREKIFDLRIKVLKEIQSVQKNPTRTDFLEKCFSHIKDAISFEEFNDMTDFYSSLDNINAPKGISLSLVGQPNQIIFPPNEKSCTIFGAGGLLSLLPLVGFVDREIQLKTTKQINNFFNINFPKGINENYPIRDMDETQRIMLLYKFRSLWYSEYNFMFEYGKKYSILAKELKRTKEFNYQMSVEKQKLLESYVKDNLDLGKFVYEQSREVSEKLFTSENVKKLLNTINYQYGLYRGRTNNISIKSMPTIENSNDLQLLLPFTNSDKSLSNNKFKKWPANLKWEDISITIIKNEKIKVNIKKENLEEERTFELSDMGFVDRRKSGNNKILWIIFEILAIMNGEIGKELDIKGSISEYYFDINYDTPKKIIYLDFVDKIKNNLPKFIQRMRDEILCPFFQISDSPIKYKKSENCFRTKFRLSMEKRSKMLEQLNDIKKKLSSPNKT